MLITKLVVRLLDEEDHMLGWAETLAEARGDGCLFVEGQTVVPIDVTGDLAFVSVHWCDVNVAVKSPCERAHLEQGNIMTLPGEWTAMVCGPAAGGLPPVTTRQSVSIGVPVGALGMKVH